MDQLEGGDQAVAHGGAVGVVPVRAVEGHLQPVAATLHEHGRALVDRRRHRRPPGEPPAVLGPRLGAWSRRPTRPPARRRPPRSAENRSNWTSEYRRQGGGGAGGLEPGEPRPGVAHPGPGRGRAHREGHVAGRRSAVGVAAPVDGDDDTGERPEERGHVGSVVELDHEKGTAGEDAQLAVAQPGPERRAQARPRPRSATPGRSGRATRASVLPGPRPTPGRSGRAPRLSSAPWRTHRGGDRPAVVPAGPAPRSSSSVRCGPRAWRLRRRGTYAAGGRRVLRRPALGRLGFDVADGPARLRPALAGR